VFFACQHFQIWFRDTTSFTLCPGVGLEQPDESAQLARGCDERCIATEANPPGWITFRADLDLQICNHTCTDFGIGGDLAVSISRIGPPEGICRAE
jgi:hypothetical protein